MSEERETDNGTCRHCGRRIWWMGDYSVRVHAHSWISDAKWKVYRKPVLQEDEGHPHFLGEFGTKEEADSFVAEYTADGYFRSGDLTVTLTASTWATWEGDR